MICVLKLQAQDYSDNYDHDYPCESLHRMLEDHPELKEHLDATRLYQECAAQPYGLDDARSGGSMESVICITRYLLRDGHKLNAREIDSNLRGRIIVADRWCVSEEEEILKIKSWNPSWPNSAYLNLEIALKEIQYVQAFKDCFIIDETTSSQEKAAIERINARDLEALSRKFERGLQLLKPHLMVNS